MTARAQEPGYFDALYAADPDPWRFTTSAYEAAKYAATLAALPRPRYPSAMEVGCSIGELTARLATKCDAVLGIDVAAAAIAAAEKRCAGLPGVRFERVDFPADSPAGRFDLVVLSEMLYYFDAPTLAQVAERVRALAEPGADLMLVHWLGPTPDYPLTGDDAVAAFEAAAPWARVMRRARTADYRLDVLRAD